MKNIINRIKAYYKKYKIIVIIVLCLVVTGGSYLIYDSQRKEIAIPLSEAIMLSQADVFEEMVVKKNILVLTVYKDTTATTKDVESKTVTLIGSETIHVSIDTELLSLKDLEAMGFVLPLTYSQEVASTWKTTAILPVIMILMLVGLYLFMTGNLFGLTGKKFKKSKDMITFADIGGMTEVKENLREVIGFLNDRQYYEKLGAIIPRGILLVGSPGTGKTMLAQAVAREANVPFYYTSGSEFHNMFVGMAALRVKQLFKAANKSPSIVFIDEFDSIAHRRGGGSTDVGREWNHTLNQLLSEMDGFKKNTKVIVMAATNRVDVLDPAAMRAGRFDRKITIPLPDCETRHKILIIHSRGKPQSKDIDLQDIAKQTGGFSGADLALLVNEAAIQAAKEHQETLTMEHLSKAIDKVLAGDEYKGHRTTAEERKLFAYHEAGHAVVATLDTNGDKVQRVTILPHGYTGGFTRTAQEKDTLVLSKATALNKIAVLLGGYVAEEVGIGDTSSGAQDDLRKANELAREMVEHYGMGKHFGIRYCTVNTLGIGENSVEAHKLIDKDINEILTKSYKVAKDIIVNHKDKLDKVSNRLLEVETLDGNELSELIGDKGI